MKITVAAALVTGLLGGQLVSEAKIRHCGYSVYAGEENEPEFEVLIQHVDGGKIDKVLEAVRRLDLHVKVDDGIVIFGYGTMERVK